MRSLVNQDKDEVPGRVVIVLKRLFKLLFPQLPAFPLADLIKFTTLGKIRYVIELLKEVKGFALEPFQILSEFKNQRAFRMKTKIINFTKKVLPQ